MSKEKYTGINSLSKAIKLVKDNLSLKENPMDELTEEEMRSMWIGIAIAPDGALSNWNYTIDGSNVILNYYIGSETDVIVYGKYQLDGVTYNTKISSNNENASFKDPYMFNGTAISSCKNITSITFNKGIDTSECTNMRYIFYNCTSLTSLDLSSFDTSNVTNMSSMFCQCNSLTEINGLEYFDTSKVTNMGAMFSGCNSLTSLDLSSFDTSKVTNMINMFNSCTSLTSLNLSNFNTSNITSMSSIFSNCTLLTEILVTSGKWVINSGCDTRYMFKNCGVSKVTYVDAA